MIWLFFSHFCKHVPISSFIHSILFNIIHNKNSLNTLQLHIKSTIHCLNNKRYWRSVRKAKKAWREHPKLTKTKEKSFKPHSNQTKLDTVFLTQSFLAQNWLIVHIFYIGFSSTDFLTKMRPILRTLSENIPHLSGTSISVNHTRQVKNQNKNHCLFFIHVHLSKPFCQLFKTGVQNYLKLICAKLYPSGDRYQSIVAFIWRYFKVTREFS